MRVFVCLIFSLLGCAGIQAQGVVRSIFYTDAAQDIYRAQPDGSGGTLVIADASSVGDIIVHSQENMVYWISIPTESGWAIKRATLTGGNIETVVTGQGRILGFGLDLTNGDLYFARPDVNSDLGRQELFVRRDAISGNEVTIISGLERTLASFGDIEIDHQADYAYLSGMMGLERVKIDVTDQTGDAVEYLVNASMLSSLDRELGLMYFNGPTSGLNPSGV